MKSLERRISYCRRCMVGTFILGGLTGLSILCGKSLDAMAGWSGSKQVSMKIFCCFLIAVTGIAAGSAYRRRIRILRESRDSLSSGSGDQKSFKKPVRERFITEIQALFVMLFLLAAASICVHYPVPQLPYLLDSNLLRLVLIVGFLALCRISISTDRGIPLADPNPVRETAADIKGERRVKEKHPEMPDAYVVKNPDWLQPDSARSRDNRSIQP